MARRLLAKMEINMSKLSLTIRSMPGPTVLNSDEEQHLRSLEAKVEASAMDFCRALAQIRSYKEGLFWKNEFGTFEEYVRVRFGFKGQHAGRLVATGNFVLRLENSKNPPKLPLRESQVRPLLNKLPEKHQGWCWKIITEKISPAALTMDIIEAEVIAYRKKNVTKEELEAANLIRAPKTNHTPPDEKARRKCYALIRQIKALSQNLPKHGDIIDLLGELKDFIAKKE